MLIVGAGLAVTAITVYLVWNAVNRGLKAWRKRKTTKQSVRERETHGR
jgi:uncharacterized membrane protein